MIQLICFSRARPLQLHGFLRSVYRWWEDAADDLLVSVVVKSEPPFEEAYEQVASEFPQVSFCPETDFCQDVRTLVDDDPEYTLFACDDVVLVAPVSSAAIAEAFDGAGSIVGLSLRLGQHVIRDMFAQPMPQPDLWPRASWLVWDATPPPINDWHYPWEVLGTVYPTKYVREMIHAFEFANPSQLEDRGWQCWAEHTDRRLMASWPTVRIVVPTVNVVQTEFPSNGVAYGAANITPERLLSLWNEGMRLDIDALAGITPESWRIPDFPLSLTMPV